MTIYERIKKRRKELNLSASDVAEALGVSRATIYRYESSYIEKLPTSTLEPLAKVLKCTPGYLIGWEPDYIVYDEQSGVEFLIEYINKDSRALSIFEAYQRMTNENKERLKKYAESLSCIESLEQPILKAAHERTDIEITEEMKKHDNDLMENF